MEKRNGNPAPGTAGHFMEEYRNYLNNFADFITGEKGAAKMKMQVAFCKMTADLFYEAIYPEILKRQPEETAEGPAAEDQPEGSETDTEREDVIIDAIAKACNQLKSDLQEVGIECEIGIVKRETVYGEE